VCSSDLSYFTRLLAAEYESVSTLGFDTTTDIGGHRSPQTDELRLPHITFNLNDSRLVDRWPISERKFDLVVFGETIEHLMVAPEYVMIFLSTLLTPNGILLVTTPNAVTLSKRLKFLCGWNPFEQIRLLGENPGHYREYTLDELVDIGRRCKLSVVYQRHVNFYNQKNIAKLVLKNLLPSLRDALIIAFQR
jgi:hypothetical protein